LKAEIDMMEMGRTNMLMTVTLKHIKQFRLRFAIAAALIRIAAWIAPVRVEVERDASF
jgi:hypothetical protein